MNGLNDYIRPKILLTLTNAIVTRLSLMDCAQRQTKTLARGFPKGQRADE
jgi:hypothetical protein